MAAVYVDGVLRLRRLDLQADDGAQVEVRGGVKAGDQLILNPPIGLADGMRVTTTPTPERRVAAMPVEDG
jgi:multidrug efflux pump subunit AcrA (membrane-fusion protein)